MIAPHAYNLKIRTLENGAVKTGWFIAHGHSLVQAVEDAMDQYGLRNIYQVLEAYEVVA